MLSSQLTLDDEDSVQAELKELQAEAVSQNNFIQSIRFPDAVHDSYEKRNQNNALICPLSQQLNPPIQLPTASRFSF
jgi:hypothetical protein